MAYLMTPKSASLAVATAALAWAGSAQAASDYLLEIEPVKSAIHASQSGDATSRGREKWIEVLSLRLVPETAASGGVNVASGDITGAKPQGEDEAAGRRAYKPPIIRKPLDTAKPVPAAPDKLADATDADTAALLLPAVQKVREAAVRMSAWEGCTAGQKIHRVSIMQKSSGRTGRILDATVSGCATESVSFNFTKIEWN